MYIKLIKALRKTTKSNSIRKNVTYNANLNVLDNEIELEMNYVTRNRVIVKRPCSKTHFQGI